MLINGIDVSKWQGKIDWQKVKAAGVEFAIIKAGGSDNGFYTDSEWESNYKGAKAAGIAVGAYYFAGKNCVTANDGKADAERFLAMLKGKQFEFPVYFDCEAQPVSAKKGTTDAAIAFCETLENAGYFVGIYASAVSGFKDRLDDSRLMAYAHWVAQYATKCTYSGNYGIWQKSSSGKINGINGNVDIDECYVDYPTTIKNKNLNGFKMAAKSSTKSSVPNFKQGQAVKLTKTTPLFANESATVAAGSLNAGIYYIYDGKICNLGRYRITTSAANCGKTPAGKYVTGYVSYDNFK